MYNENLNRLSLSEFELKHKDIKTIHRILTKRKTKTRETIESVI